ncbi:MAG: nucleotidyltransferase domain-containing protein [Bacteroidales bacterium]|nr:nucleotidyltransferase domain-containing protein [Bacteroidales bacterium]
MIPIIISEKEKINKLFKNHKVVKAYIFGSAIKSDFNINSDIDFLITFQDDLEPLEKGELWWSLHDSLRNLLNREIDLLTERSLKNPYLIKELDRTKQLVWKIQ